MWPLIWVGASGSMSKQQQDLTTHVIHIMKILAGYSYWESIVHDSAHVYNKHCVSLCTPWCKPPHATNNFYLDLELVNGYNRHIKIPIKNAVFWHAFHPHNSMSHNGSTSTRIIREKSIGIHPPRDVRMPSEAPEIHLPIQPTAMATAETAKVFLFWGKDGGPVSLTSFGSYAKSPCGTTTAPINFPLATVSCAKSWRSIAPIGNMGTGRCVSARKAVAKWKSKWVSSLLGVIFSSFWYRNLQVKQEFMFPFTFAFVKIAEVWIAHEHLEKLESRTLGFHESRTLYFVIILLVVKGVNVRLGV